MVRRLLRESSSSRDREPKKQGDVLQSRGHLPEREMESVSLRPPPVHKSCQQGPVEREAS